MADGLLKNRASLDEFSQKRNQAQLGANLFEAGLTQMGNPGAGKAIGEYLRQEWWRKEAETFNATVGQGIQSKLNGGMDAYKKKTKLTTQIGAEGQDPSELQRGYYSEYDETGTPVTDSFIPADDFMGVNTHLNSAASEMIGGLQSISMEYMDEAAKFPNNPLIESAAKGMMNHITGSFENQLTSIQLADKQQAQRMNVEKAEQAKQATSLAKVKVPEQIKREGIRTEAAEYDRDKMRASAKAEDARGRQIYAMNGGDPGELTPEDSSALYRNYKMQIQDATDIAALQVHNKGAKLPTGINMSNIGDWLAYDTKGQGILKSFMDEEARKATTRTPVKNALDNEAKAYMSEPNATFADVPEGKDKDALVNKVLGSPEVFEVLRQDAINNATEHLINTQQLGQDFGLQGMQVPLGVDGGNITVPMFKDADQAQRILNPKLFEEENTEKYKSPNESEEAWDSGDPEDPFGDASIDDNSPLSEVSQERARTSIEGYREWIEDYGNDLTVPPRERARQAHRAIKDITEMMDALGVRQSIYGQDIPDKEYVQQTAELLDLRAKYQALATRPKEAVDVSKHLVTDIKAALGSMRESSQILGEMVDHGSKNMAEGINNVIDYLELPEEWKKANREAAKEAREAKRKEASKGGIFRGPPKPRGIMDEIKRSGVPFWMADEEEKQRRKAAFDEHMSRFGR